MMEKLTGAFPSREEIRNKGRAVFWLLRRALPGRWKQVSLIVAASFAGVTTGTMAFGLLLIYVRSQAKGRALPMQGAVHLVAAAWGSGVLPYAMAALLLGSASAVFTYSSKRGALYVARDFHSEAVEEAIRKAQQSSGEISEIQMLSPSHQLSHIPTLYLRYAGNVLRMFLEAVHPLVTSVVAVAALFYINFGVTLALIPLAGIGLYSLARLSGRGARLLRRYQTRISEMGPLVKKLCKAPGEQEFEAEKPCLSSSQSEILNDTLDSLYDQTLLSRQVLLVNNLLQIFSITLLVLLLGRNLEGGASSWSSILAYVIALRYAWQCVGRLSVFLVEMGRFLPSVEICAAYLGEAPQLKTTAGEVVLDG